MIREIIEQLFGEDEWEEVDHDAVARELEAAREERQVEFSRSGEYPFDHYTDAPDRVRDLKRERRHDEAEDLLLWCIDFVEEEAAHFAKIDWAPSIAPWYYKHLAIVYRKDDRRDDEVAILERYMDSVADLNQEAKDELVDRLERARELAGSTEKNSADHLQADEDG